jgi:hypothetical protein
MIRQTQRAMRVLRQLSAGLAKIVHGENDDVCIPLQKKAAFFARPERRLRLPACRSGWC